MCAVVVRGLLGLGSAEGGGKRFASWGESDRAKQPVSSAEPPVWSREDAPGWAGERGRVVHARSVGVRQPVCVCVTPGPAGPAAGRLPEMRWPCSTRSANVTADEIYISSGNGGGSCENQIITITIF